MQQPSPQAECKRGMAIILAVAQMVYAEVAFSLIQNSAQFKHSRASSRPLRLKLEPLNAYWHRSRCNRQTDILTEYCACALRVNYLKDSLALPTASSQLVSNKSQEGVLHLWQHLWSAYYMRRCDMSMHVHN